MHQKDIKMNQNQYHDSVIDNEILNRVIKDSKCTKYVKQYSPEFRIQIYILRTKHNLSYRQIIVYCQYKYDLSPSIGHIKRLIQDGENAFKGSTETNMENSENMSQKNCNNYEGESATETTLSENERKLQIFNELKPKLVDFDVFTPSIDDQLYYRL